MSLPKDPFDELALCLSGGGYRAASFHLGSMDYLNRLQYKGTTLLEKVNALSTVSGGTITGAFYAYKKNQGSDFNEVYTQLVDFLHNHDLIVESLKKINPDGKWESSTRSRNLINAFAEIYDKALMNGATFKELTFSNNSHLKFVCFNSTEFTTGINFRFQCEWRGNKQNKMLKRGNAHFTFSFNVLEEIKLADVIAASSCFPGGFEPINFPADFIYRGAEELKALMRHKSYHEGLGLMDGGIYDNQGIDAIQLSEKRRYKESITDFKPNGEGRKPYDLLIISDVSSPDISNPFSFHLHKERTVSDYSIHKLRSKSLALIKTSMWLPVFLILIGFVLGFTQHWDDSRVTGVAITILILGTLTLLIRWILISKITSWIEDLRDIIKSLIGSFFTEKLSILQLNDIKFRHVEPLIADRVNSLSLMVQEIFLKQVRRLKYRSIYEDKLYENRRISNLIKELTRDDWEKTSDYQAMNKLDRILKGNHRKVVGSRLGALASEASSFGTTLWFTDRDKLNEKLNKLIALGQATMCFNIMAHITKLKNNPEYNNYPRSTKMAITKMFNQCKEDWKSFKKDPLFLVKNHAST